MTLFEKAYSIKTEVDLNSVNLGFVYGQSRGVRLPNIESYAFHPTLHLRPSIERPAS